MWSLAYGLFHVIACERSERMFSDPRERVGRSHLPLSRPAEPE